MDPLSQPLIAVRIKDGIFVGNVTAAHDDDFLFMNKINGIVNCAGAEVRDMFGDTGIQYLNFPWKDTQSGVCTTVMFDSGDRNVDQTVRFIDQCLETGECVLVHSYYGVSRSCALVCAYLMVKYGWRLESALQFLTMAHPDTNIKPYFLRQLRMFAKRHTTEVDIFHEDIDDSRFGLDNDQWMLRNTLLNGLTCDAQSHNNLYKHCARSVEIPEANFKNPMKRRRRLAFVDTKQGTAVSGSTVPVVQPKPHYVDPMSGNFSGKMGLTALRASAQPEAILARRGTPNRRKLESLPESQPKGRQVLYVRTPSPPPPSQGLGRQPGAACPPPPGQYPLDRREQVTVHNRELLHHPSPRSEAPPAPQAGVGIRSNQLVGPREVQRGRAEDPRTVFDDPPLSDRGRTGGGGGGGGSSSSSGGGGGAPTQKWSPSSGTIRSPFAVTAQGSKARNGSPLPQPRRSGGAAPASTSASTGSTGGARGSSGTAGAGHHSAPPSSGGGSQAHQTLRYGSPAAIPSFQQAQAQVARTSSPMGRAGTGSSNSSGHQQPMPSGAAERSTAIRRTSSPLSRVGSGASSIPNAQATISHEAIRSMTMPQRQPQYNPPSSGSSYSRSSGGTGGVGGAQRTSSPMTQQRRTASPLGNTVGGARTSSPIAHQSRVGASGVPRTNSPTRSGLVGGGGTSGGYNSPRGSGSGGVSLAEQYLGMGLRQSAGQSSISAGGAASSSGRLTRDTNASIMRRQQGNISAHR